MNADQEQDEQDLSRRNFLSATAIGGMGVAALQRASQGAEPGEADAVARQDKELPALPQIRLLADLFLQWQMDFGRLNPRRAKACATWGPKRNSYKRWATALNQAWRATQNEAYRGAADRLAVFYLGCLCDAPKFHPPHFGLGMGMYGELKRNYPHLLDFDEKAAAFFAWMQAFRWNEPSYYRNGYPGGEMEDAANSCDNAEAGLGLMAYFSVKKDPEVLAAAEGLANYFLTEVKPGTYQGVWSSQLGTWVVAPTTQDRFEHFEGASSDGIAWGYTSVIAIEYLLKLGSITEKQELQQGIVEKCVASMKWQFDACQFDDGACGLSGRDDKWLGMTAAAILSYLRVRDGGHLAERQVAQYRPKALAARDWLLANVSRDNLLSKSPGYFPVRGKSLPKPPDNISWMLGYTLQALLVVQNI